jgi:hypothetical protein
MSWSATFQLPKRELNRAIIEAAMAKLVRPPSIKLGPPPWDAEIDEGSDEQEEEEDFDLGAIELSVGLLGRVLSQHGDRPESEPDDDGYFWGLIVVYPADEDDDPQIIVHSNDAQNRSCWMSIGDLAGHLSVTLGGPAEPEPE